MIELSQAWEQAASRVDGRFSRAAHGGPRIVTYLSEQLVQAEIKPFADHCMTTVSADAGGESELRLAVSVDPEFPFADSFSIPVASDFDARFTTHTNDGPYAQLWLDDEVRAAIAETQRYHFVLDDGIVRGWMFGEERDAEALVATMQAVVGLARGGAKIRGGWRDLAAKLGGKVLPAGAPKGSMAIAVRPSWGQDMTIEGFYGVIARRRTGRGVVTRVRCARQLGAGDSFAIEDTLVADGFAPEVRNGYELEPLARRYRIHCSAPALMRARLAGLESAIVELAASAIVVDKALATVLLPELVTDATRINAAIELLRKLAGGAHCTQVSGPYR